MLNFTLHLLLGIAYVAYGQPQPAQAANTQGCDIAQPGYAPSNMNYAVSYNANAVAPLSQMPCKLFNGILLHILL